MVYLITINKAKLLYKKRRRLCYAERVGDSNDNGAKSFTRGNL